MFFSLNLICPQNYNPADFYINCLTKKRIPQLCQKFDNLPTENHSFSQKTELRFDSRRPKINFFQELRWLLWRNFLDMSRKKIIYMGGYLCVMVNNNNTYIVEFLKMTLIFLSRLPVIFLSAHFFLLNSVMLDLLDIFILIPIFFKFQPK